MTPTLENTVVPTGNISSPQDGQLLHDAVRRGDTKAVARLLESGASVEARGAHKRTPILVAAKEGHADIVRLLLTAGAEVDARGESMNITPLMAAARRGEAPLVRLLLEAGADPNATGRNGAGALARVAITGDTATAQALLSARADPSGTGLSAAPNTAPLWAAVVMKRVELVKLLVAQGAQVNTGDSTSDTLFGAAVSGGDAEIARVLLEAGADPTRPALANLPLLAVALRFVNPPMAKLLEDYGFSLAKSEDAGSVVAAPA